MTKIISIKRFFAKDIFTKDVCLEDAIIKNTYTKGICIKDVYIKNAFVEAAYMKNSFTKDANAIKHLKMHLQFFQILKMKLFEIRLKTRVGIS